MSPKEIQRLHKPYKKWDKLTRHLTTHQTKRLNLAPETWFLSQPPPVKEARTSSYKVESVLLHATTIRLMIPFLFAFASLFSALFRVPPFTTGGPSTGTVA